MKKDFSIRDYNLSQIAIHRSTFRIGEPYAMREFVGLASTLKHYRVECSCKVEGGRLYPARFNVWFKQKACQQAIKAVLNFFHNVEAYHGIELNYELWRQFYTEDFDFSRVQRFIAGVDLRDTLAESRLKMWFIIDDYEQKREAAIRLHGDSEELRLLMIHDELLVGFDFYLDGQQTIKIYPDVGRDELTNTDIKQRFARVLSQPALELMKLCHRAHVSFGSEKQDRIIHYHPIESMSFVNTIVRNDLAQEVDLFYRSRPVLDQVVSLREREIIEGVIESVNLYYKM